MLLLNVVLTECSHFENKQTPLHLYSDE